MSKRLTTEEFIDQARKVHGDRYDYSLTKYVSAKEKVKIICREHGIYEKSPDNHLRRKSGCRKCAFMESSKKQSLTKEEFIKRAKEVYGDKYDYSKVKYKNNRTKVVIICPNHGEFKQVPSSHLVGKECVKCGIEKKAFSQASSQEYFIAKSQEIHGDLYDYSKVRYKNAHIKVTITCKKHGDFKQKPNNHLFGNGCPLCNVSYGERSLAILLKKRKINFQQQYIFEDCKNTLPLSFDFYLPDQNLCIEYNGMQHYEPVEYFGGKKAFESQKLRDQIKKDYCRDKGIDLLIIRYDECIKTKMRNI